MIDIYNVHRNPQHWENPLEFNPNRFFDQKEKRNPFAFIPFLGGKRICLGKTFAEMVTKLTAFTFLNGDFDYQFMDEKDYHSKQQYNIGSFVLPKLKCKAIARNANNEEKSN